MLCHDRLASMVQGLKNPQGINPALELITAIQLYIAGESLELPDSEQAVASITAAMDVNEGNADQPESVSIAWPMRLMRKSLKYSWKKPKS